MRQMQSIAYTGFCNGGLIFVPSEAPSYHIQIKSNQIALLAKVPLIRSTGAPSTGLQQQNMEQYNAYKQEVYKNLKTHNSLSYLLFSFLGLRPKLSIGILNGLKILPDFESGATISESGAQLPLPKSRQLPLHHTLTQRVPGSQAGYKSREIKTDTKLN